MPKDTFYRLSQDKRQRIMDAADEEFHRVPYSQTSINQIIKAAGISRGSFYQYFEDKEDLFGYVLSQKGTHFFETLRDNLERVNGDIFQLVDLYLDRFIQMGDMRKLFFDEELIHLILHMGVEKNMFQSFEQNLEDNILKEIRFENVNVEGREEQLILMKIIASVFGTGASRMVHQRYHADPMEICDDMKKMIRQLEKHYRK